MNGEGAPGFTPGPWHVESGGALGWLIVSEDRSQLTIGDVHDVEDAGLIAAAPDLYAALWALHDAIHIETDATRNERLMAHVRAALAKAEGREPQP